MDIIASQVEPLQGCWEQIGHEADGLVNPPDEHGAMGAVTTISGNTFKVRTAEGFILLEGSFSLDATQAPKAVYWIDAIGVDAGKVLPASYTLEGDRFVFIAADEGDPRPKTFKTVPGLTLRAFRRLG